MSGMMRAVCCFLFFAYMVHGADAPDGTTFNHSVLAVDSADKVRIRFCGVPLQVKLANLQFKGSDSEKLSLKYLKETLRPGSDVKIELEPDVNMDSPAPPLAQVFSGGTHLNLEMVKRGFAISDGRSKKFSNQLQAAQMDAMEKKQGLWANTELASAPVKAASKPADAGSFIAPTPKPVEPTVDLAPENYGGAVVADLSSKEYHYPLSRYAKSIRAAARIEYKSPDEAERAGKIPSPFSFPERSKAIVQKQSSASGGSSPTQVVETARKAYADALAFMQEARKASRTNSSLANENWKKAAKIINEQLNRVVPLSDADPSNKDLQKLTEDMSMSLYSCNKYQSL